MALSPATNLIRFSGAIAVQAWSEPVLSPGADVYLRAVVRIPVQQPLLICLGSSSKSKKCDKQLTHSTYDKSIVSGALPK